MKKSGITLIALIVTIVVLLILATVSIAVLTEGNLIETSRKIRTDQRINDSKETIRAVTNQVIGTGEYKDVFTLAADIQTELRKIKGLENVTVTPDVGDHIVSMPYDILLSFEEATGKKLPTYISTYVTKTELEGR